MFGTEPQPLKRKWKRGYWTVEGIWGQGVEVFVRNVAVPTPTLCKGCQNLDEMG